MTLSELLQFKTIGFWGAEKCVYATLYCKTLCKYCHFPQEAVICEEEKQNITEGKKCQHLEVIIADC